MTFSTKIIHPIRYVFVCPQSCSLAVLMTELTFLQGFVFIWRQISGDCTTTPFCSPTLRCCFCLLSLLLLLSPKYCWSSFQLYSHLLSFSGIVAGDRIQRLLPFGAFFTFTICLISLGRAGNHSRPEKFPPKYRFSRGVVWHPHLQHPDYICNLCAELLCEQPMTNVIGSRLGAKNPWRSFSKGQGQSHMPWNC